MTSNDILGDVVVYDLDLLFKGQRFELRPFVKLIISRKLTGSANTTISNTWEVVYWLSIDIFTFDHGPF